MLFLALACPALADPQTVTFSASAMNRSAGKTGTWAYVDVNPQTVKSTAVLSEPRKCVVKGYANPFYVKANPEGRNFDPAITSTTPVYVTRWGSHGHGCWAAVNPSNGGSCETAYGPYFYKVIHDYHWKMTIR